MRVEPKRGEIWTLAGGGGPLTSKPRPVLVLTSDVFSDFDFSTVLLITTEQTTAFTRIPLPADAETGLTEPSLVQADKIVTVLRRNLKQRIGIARPAVLTSIREAVSAYLGFGG